MYDRKTLLQYLSEIIDMEKTTYLQRQLLSKLTDRYDRLKREYDGIIAKEILKPNLEEEKATLYRKDETLQGSGLAGIIMMAIGFLIYATIPNKGSLVVAIGVFIGILGIGPFVISILNFRIEPKEEAEKRNKSKKDTYKSQITNREAAISRLLPEKRVLESEISKLRQKLVKSENVLEQMYGINIVYKSYRGFANVCAIYDYLASGTANTLPEAYRILIHHIDAGVIITNLEAINDKLTQIMYNQRLTYDAIVDANRKIDSLWMASNNMIKEIERIGGNVESIDREISRLSKNSEFTAYFAECSAKQLEYLNHMSYYYGIFGDNCTVGYPPPKL